MNRKLEADSIHDLIMKIGVRTLSRAIGVAPGTAHYWAKLGLPRPSGPKKAERRCRIEVYIAALSGWTAAEVADLAAKEDAAREAKAAAKKGNEGKRRVDLGEAYSS